MLVVDDCRDYGGGGGGRGDRPPLIKLSDGGIVLNDPALALLTENLANLHREAMIGPTYNLISVGTGFKIIPQNSDPSSLSQLPNLAAPVTGPELLLMRADNLSQKKRGTFRYHRLQFNIGDDSLDSIDEKSFAKWENTAREKFGFPSKDSTEPLSTLIEEVRAAVESLGTLMNTLQNFVTRMRTAQMHVGRGIVAGEHALEGERRDQAVFMSLREATTKRFLAWNEHSLHLCLASTVAGTSDAGEVTPLVFKLRPVVVTEGHVELYDVESICDSSSNTSVRLAVGKFSVLREGTITPASPRTIFDLEMENVAERSQEETTPSWRLRWKGDKAVQLVLMSRPSKQGSGPGNVVYLGCPNGTAAEVQVVVFETYSSQARHELGVV